MKNIAIINGANLNMLGTRETSIYGAKTLEDINKELVEMFKAKANLIFFQSNHEGKIIDFIQELKNINGIIINPGAFTHTSIAIRDALLIHKVELIEVHLSNIHAREDFRKKSLISDIAKGVITGLGAKGYQLALTALC